MASSSPSRVRRRKSRGGSVQRVAEQVPRPTQASPEPPHTGPQTPLQRILELDKWISQWVHDQGLGLFFYVFLRILEFSGDGLFLIPCAAATFLAPTPKLTPAVRMFFFNLFMAFLFDLISVSIIKKIVRRPRPSYSNGHFVTMSVDLWSFPSGHSTRALMVVTFFWLYVPMWKEQSARVWMPFLNRSMQDRVQFLPDFVPAAENLLISLIAAIVTTWAVATTSSRIILGRHFFCDVVAGSLVGFCETVVAHYFLFIPQETSEYLHQCVNSIFASIEGSLWRLFHKDIFEVEHLTHR